MFRWSCFGKWLPNKNQRWFLNGITIFRPFLAMCVCEASNTAANSWGWNIPPINHFHYTSLRNIQDQCWEGKSNPKKCKNMQYRRSCYFHSKIVDSLTAWVGGRRKTEFSWTPASQAVSESRIFEWKYQLLRYSFYFSAQTWSKVI